MERNILPLGSYGEFDDFHEKNKKVYAKKRHECNLHELGKYKQEAIEISVCMRRTRFAWGSG